MCRLILLAVLVLGGGALGAQEPPPPPPPPVPPVPPPGPPATGTPVPTDTSDMTARYLEAGEGVRQILQPVARGGINGLLPAGGRVVLTVDSLDWANAATVAELLQRVAGVFLLRGYWIGTPQVPLFRGQAGTGIEYLVDGIPWLPIGDDSTSVDPSLLPISLFDEIEIEPQPAGLRVHLFTRRHDRAAPRSRIAIGTGDLDIARYQGSLEKRFPNGFGFSGGFDFLSVGALRDSRFNDYQNTAAWLQGSWVRSPRSGAVLQYLLSSPIRRPGFGSATTTADTLSRPLEEGRRDLQLRYYVRGGDEGLGPSLDLVASRTTWDARDSVVVRDSLAPRHRALTQVGAIAGYRTATTSWSVRALRRDDWTRLDLFGQGALALAEPLTVAVEAGYRTHTGDRRSEWVMASGSLRLPLGLVAHGAWKLGTVVDLPMLEADTSRKVDDRSASLAWEQTGIRLAAGYARTGAATPAPTWVWPALGVIRRVGVAEWFTGEARLTPRNWLTVSGWFATPRGGARVEGQPPTHGLATAAIRSKFLRVFPSGFFELKAALTVESHGTGTLGREADGDPVILRGTTYGRSQLQLQFGEFTAYWDRQNLFDARSQVIPGMRILPGANTFGIRWVFWN